MNERIWFTCHACGHFTHAKVTATAEQRVYTVTCPVCGKSEDIKMVTDYCYRRVRRIMADANA